VRGSADGDARGAAAAALTACRRRPAAAAQVRAATGGCPGGLPRRAGSVAKARNAQHACPARRRARAAPCQVRVGGGAVRLQAVQLHQLQVNCNDQRRGADLVGPLPRQRRPRTSATSSGVCRRLQEVIGVRALYVQAAHCQPAHATCGPGLDALEGGWHALAVRAQMQQLEFGGARVVVRQGALSDGLGTRIWRAAHCLCWSVIAPAAAAAQGLRQRPARHDRSTTLGCCSNPRVDVQDC